MTTSRTHPRRRMLATLCLLFAVGFNGMCNAGRLAVLKSALNASPALTGSLVASSAISPQDAEIVNTDFVGGAKIAVQLGQDLNAIPPGAANRAQLQFAAAHKAFTDWRAIYDLGHFNVHPRVQAAALVADGIFVFFDAFYGDQAGNNPHSDVAVDGLSQKEFEEAVDQKLKSLKRAMKP